MANTFDVVVGGAGAWTLTLLDASDAPVTTWTAAASLAAACWPGDDLAALFAPTVAWDDPAAGTVVLSISAAQSALLEAGGRYPINLTIDGSNTREIGVVVAGAAPGSGVQRPVYAGLDDLRRHAGGWLDRLGKKDDSQAGFREERADARAAFEEALHAAYEPNSATRQTTLDDLWPESSRTVGLRDPWLAAALLAGQLVVTRRILDINAKLALAAVCRRQVQPKDDEGWAEAACAFAADAESLMARTTAEVDADGDGVGDVAIHLGTIRRIRA